MCLKCTSEERTKRGCEQYPDGTYCGHMFRARDKVFGKAIDTEMELLCHISQKNLLNGALCAGMSPEMSKR